MGILDEKISRDGLKSADLVRMRAELAEQVTELHWDLGGLAYEMAIRDHFRLDVLVRRAAVLQERDAELAEIESLLRMEEGAAESPGLRLPAPRVSALLVLVLLGFGVLLGSVAGSPVRGSLASTRSPLKLVMPPVSAAVAAPTESSEQEESEPPETEAEETPEPASTPAGKATKAPSGSGDSTPATKLPPIKHVFVVMLSNQPYAAVFGPESTAHYLAHTLERKGVLLVRYDAVAHEQLANGVALISGQGPTTQTAANCPTYSDLTPAAAAGAEGQVLGNGCVYPASTQTLAGQLMAKHLSWRAYVEGMDEGANQTGAGVGACVHPALGQADPTADPTAAQAPAGGPYATFRNPFVYFHSILDSPACAANDVGLDKLRGDLADPRRTPSFSYIAPDRCHDANPVPCATGAPAGLAPADGLLKRVIPEITASRAYKDGGLIVVTVDQAPSSGEYADSSSCCGQPSFPNLTAAAPAGSSPQGGGTVGALLLSPYVKGGTTNPASYNHFSLLRTIEDFFGLDHLGYAGLQAVKPFAAALFIAHKQG